MTISTLTDKKIAYSTLVQYAGKIAQLFLAGLTIKLISSFLSENDYGIYAKITEYALFLSVVANLGIFGNVVRKMGENPKNGYIFINALILRIASAVIFFTIGILLIIFRQNDLIFISATILFLSALLFDYITSVCDGALQALYLMGRAVIALIIGRLVQFLGIYWLIANILGKDDSQDIFYLFLPAMTGALITALISYYFVRQKITWQWKVDMNFIYNILKLSLPFGIINIINNLYFRFLPDLLISKLPFISNKEFGSFEISFRIAQVISLFSTFLMFSALPMLRKNINEKNWTDAISLYKKIGLLLGIAGIAVIVFGSILGPELIELLTHKKYVIANLWFVLPMLLTLSAISYGYDLILITLFALERDFWILKNECFALISASIIFLLSMFYIEGYAQLAWIIIGAIAGETYMVLSGLYKIRRCFEKSKQI